MGLGLPDAVAQRARLAAAVCVGAAGLGAIYLWWRSRQSTKPVTGAATAESSVKVDRVFIVLGGKRKCGKDYVADVLQSMFGSRMATICRLSGPLKRKYAEEHNLDYQRLLDASDYKERYRKDMIRWGEAKRQQDPGYFCRAAIENATTPVIIISDARRTTDISFFKNHFNCLTLRVEAPQRVRERRGFQFTPGVDDAESECGLDSHPFDMRITNDALEGLPDQALLQLKQLKAKVLARLA